MDDESRQNALHAYGHVERALNATRQAYELLGTRHTPVELIDAYCKLEQALRQIMPHVMKRKRTHHPIPE